MEVWRRTDTERKGEEEEGGVREVNLKSQIATSSGAKKKGLFEVTIWNLRGSMRKGVFEVTICDLRRNET